MGHLKLLCHFNLDYGSRMYPGVRMFQLEADNTTLDKKVSAEEAKTADVWVNIDELLQKVKDAINGKQSYAPWLRLQTG